MPPSALVAVQEVTGSTANRSDERLARPRPVLGRALSIFSISGGQERVPEPRIAKPRHRLRCRETVAWLWDALLATLQIGHHASVVGHRGVADLNSDEAERIGGQNSIDPHP